LHSKVLSEINANRFAGTGELNAHISERFKGGRSRPHANRDTASEYDNLSNITLNTDILRYVQEAERYNYGAETGDWRGLPEIPTNDEVSMASDDIVKLLPNKIRGKFKTNEKYLRIQYALQREDAVSPLRDAVDRFRKDPAMSDDASLYVYEKVHIVGFTFSQLGLAARLEFSTARAGRHILWQASKRLKSGTLVALTPADNNFESRCIVALVAARPLDLVQPPHPEDPPGIDIFFCRNEDIQIDPQQEFVMIEAKSGYYEAYRHTLQALQKLSHEKFPLSQHVCSVTPDIEPPAYLQENPVIDMEPATAEDQEQSYGKVDVLNEWPSHSLSTLDPTQWDALRQILTKSLAIIQGPPGTGKTFVSKVALELLHRNLDPNDPPIIIAAQTNHALDQLLGHVSKFEPNYIRLGGRSTVPEVRKRALYEIRRANNIEVAGSLAGRARTSWRLQSKKMVELLEPLHQEVMTPFSMDTLLSHGVISPKQHKSLGAGAARWVTGVGKTAEPMDLWADRALIPFSVDRGVSNFAHVEDDEDLEIEQLKEHEAEHGVNDEEDKDLLKGDWCVLRDAFTVMDPPESDLERAGQLLDTEQDLWKFPEHLRGAAYKVMQTRLKANLLTKFRALAATYNGNLRNLKVGKWERDAVFLEQAKIIGLTTTGLSKYRPLISALKPKIILIEEAAEVLEAPVTVACMESVEHLILVGDHQQLQGHCSVKDLEGEPYFLNISLFERLVNNDIPFRTLLEQRRMDPKFRQLIRTLYPELRDHPSVLNREKPRWGMGNIDSFFFTHSYGEMTDNQMSSFNEPEAKHVAGFYRHLVQNGVASESITILTFYNGQRKKLLREIRAFDDIKDHYAKVKTVDSYQGEENDIVILSLTRSNDYGRIGFLEVDNRVCVALSRAKLGFYLFGNGDLLSARSELWAHVVNTMSGMQRLANEQFPVFCDKHEKTTIIENTQDWHDIHGGCDKLCNEELECGHQCRLKCHPMPHSEISCGERCGKALLCGHPCQLPCYEQCRCNCPAWEDAQEHAQEPETANGLNGSYQDLRRALPQESSSVPPLGTPRRYISGQHDSLPKRRAFYLPDQAQTHINQSPLGLIQRESPLGMNPHLHGTNLHGMINQAGTMVDGTQEMIRTRIRPGSGYGTLQSSRSPSSSGDIVDRCHLSPQYQAGQRAKWSKFANGGVKRDDAKRGWSNNEPGPSMTSRDWPALGSPVKESKKDVGKGRARYTQVFETGSPKAK
jgi:helicase required for RNAi-mediated heterochromatin assembly 1